MSDITCIIVEDEPLAAKVLADYISQVPFLKLNGIFKDAIIATEFLRDSSVDLIFLDIHLPKLKGLAFLKTLSHPPAIILTTAYQQYAVEGFDLNAKDYLLKPIDFERFLVAVNKVKSASSQQRELTQSGDKKNYFFLNVQKRKVKILFSEIAYIESQREYIKIVTEKKEYTSKISTNEIENMLPAHEFKRIHRSFIVALNKIDSYNAEMVEVNGVSIPIGRGYRHVTESL